MGQAGDQPTHHNGERDKMIGSLGDALAGMSVNQNTGSFGYEGRSDTASTTASSFVSNAAQYISNGHDGINDGMWSPPSGYPGSSAAPGFPSVNNMSGIGLTASADQTGNRTLLSGIVNSETTTPASSKQSLELFLSQSPSKTLGTDLLKLSAGTSSTFNQNEQPLSRSASGFSLEEMGRATTTNSLSRSSSRLNITSSPGDLRQTHDPTVRRKADSPSTSVTGTSTSSRSASPYANVHEGDHRRTIQAFAGTELPVNNSSSRPFVQHQATAEVNCMISMSKGYAGENNQVFRTSNIQQQQVYSVDYNSPYYHHGMERMPSNQYGGRQAHHPAPAPAPQVLYMTVPTPDGRGQMLQPVQMVQIQGQPSTFVLPPTTGAGAASSHQPTMVVLPPQTAASDMNGAPATLSWSDGSTQYSTGGARVSDNHYVQYGARAPTEDYISRPNQDLPFNQRTNPLVDSHTPGDSISTLNTTPHQRPPLDELLGNVRRLCRDQLGCRLLQQALDEEGSAAASMILQEGLSFWGEAMIDPFGNYLFQKILEKASPDERVMLIKTVSARLVNASLNLHGTRSVQKVVEICALDETRDRTTTKMDPADESASEVLARSLAPAAARLCIDSHGNHVIQRILLKLGPAHSKFVFDAVAASVGDVARHRHGCCVIQRCLDSPSTEARSNLVRRIVEKSLDLMQDAYGNYVVQYVLDVCNDAEVHAVCESVVGRVSLLAIQKFSSNVMEKCFERCTDRVKNCYLQEISEPERIRELMMDPFGNYVVQRALSVASHAQAVTLVEAMRPHLLSSQPGAPYGKRNASGMRNTAGGRRIMAKICRRFPNFTLSEGATPDELYGSQSKGRGQSHQLHQQELLPAGPPGLSLHQGSHHQGSHHQGTFGLGQQQAQYGGDPHRARHQVEQNNAYYETVPPGYYDHMLDRAPYPQM